MTTPWQGTPDLTVRALIAAGLLALAGWLTVRRHFPGRRSLVAVNWVMAAWLVGSILEHAALDPGCKVSFGLLTWAPINALPALWCLFLLCYIHGAERRPSTRVAVGVTAMQVTLVALIWTNGGHGLMYGADTHLAQAVAGMPRMRYAYGPLFYAVVVINYAWLLASVGLLAHAWLHSSPSQRPRWTAFLLAMSVPVGANLAYLIGGVRVLGADPTATGFATLLIVAAWLTRRRQFDSVVPMAHRLLFVELRDPVFVIDPEGQVVETNHAALALEAEAPQMGQPLRSWPRLGRRLPPLLQQLDGASPGAEATVPLLELTDPPATYEVFYRVLSDQKRSIGALVQLHDVTVRHAALQRTVGHLAEREVELERATATQALLREQAMHDPLTGLLNRRAFDERMALELKVNAEAVSRDTAPPPTITLVLMDLDHFKRINDRHGHALGDAVLRDFAQALRSGLRADDALFRIGGEEFALLLPDTPPPLALRRVQALRELVTGWRLGGLPQPVTFSAGVGQWRVGRDGLAEWMDRVDRALYMAKGLGRDRVELVIDEPTPAGAARSRTPA